jgi:hypothetical protein
MCYAKSYFILHSHLCIPSVLCRSPTTIVFDIHILHLTQIHGFSSISVIGIIDGGTWEHRKRAKEMLETAEKNNLQSLAGRGSHFMGDFLPVSACGVRACTCLNSAYDFIVSVFHE